MLPILNDFDKSVIHKIQIYDQKWLNMGRRRSFTDRKYKDYVYRKMLVQEYLKK